MQLAPLGSAIDLNQEAVAPHQLLLSAVLKVREALFAWSMANGDDTDIVSDWTAAGNGAR